MTCMKDCKTKKALNSKTICALIKVCSEAGVTELKFGDLHILFAPTEIGRIPDVKPEKPVEQIEKETLLKDEIHLKETQFDELFLTDPAEYERQLRLGELEDGHSRTESAV